MSFLLQLSLHFKPAFFFYEMTTNQQDSLGINNDLGDADMSFDKFYCLSIKNDI